MKLKMTSPGALFAELVVVVVGILLALGIDQAMAERADRELETAYLAALREDFEATLTWTAENGPRINSDREASALLLAEVLDGDTAIRDSVAVAQALVRLTAVPHLRVFEARLQPGPVPVVQDVETVLPSSDGLSFRSTALHPDGDRVIVRGEAGGDSPSEGRVILVRNFLEEVKRRVPN